MEGTHANVAHGELVDVLRPSRKSLRVVLIPAIVRLIGSSFSPVFQLRDWSKYQRKELPQIVGGEENAPWALGRLIRLFNAENTPEAERCEKTCVDTSFCAVFPDKQNLAIPFNCQDYYGQSAMYFSSENEPNSEYQRTIAEAF